MERKYIYYWYIHLELTEKEFFSCAWWPNDLKISCNESDVDSLDDFEIEKNTDASVYPSRSELFAHSNIPAVTYGEYALARLLK